MTVIGVKVVVLSWTIQRVTSITQHIHLFR